MDEKERVRVFQSFEEYERHYYPQAKEKQMAREYRPEKHGAIVARRSIHKIKEHLTPRRTER